MRSLARPASPLARLCTWVLRGYLCLLVSGCGAHRPALITWGPPARQSRPATKSTVAKQPKPAKPKPAEQPKLAKQTKAPKSPKRSPVAETHLFLGDEETAYRSCVAALRDAGYEVDDAGAEEGVIEGILITHERQGAILDENRPELEPMPRWQAGVMVLTSAAMLVGGALAVTQGLLGNNMSGATAEKRVGAGLALMSVASSFDLPPPSVYDYRIAIQLLPMEGNTTQIRVLLD